MASRDQVFSQIKAEYEKLEQELRETDRGLVFRTEKGIYGTTKLDSIYAFFREIDLQNYSRFLDLGCGDGRVVLVASLFTRATGIEHSAELVGMAERIRDRLGLKAELLVGDYLGHDISRYDLVFINPDHGFGELDSKLARELKGPLFVYNEIFAPESLKKGRKYWYGQVPVVKYTRA